MGMVGVGPFEHLRSRVVRAATILLPVVAILLLSMLFIVARQVNPDGVQVDSVDISERAQSRQLTMPRFTGVTRDGTTFDLSARTALPDMEDPRRMTADALRLVLGDAADPDGTRWATLIADMGEIDTADRTAILTGDVRIETSTGYRLRSQRLDGTFAAFEIVSPGPVDGDGPLGTLQAGGMRLSETDGRQTIVFTDGVELVYTPPT